MLKILLPVDGSATALAAVRHALQLVHNGLSAHFVLANVQTPATLYELVTAHDPDVIDQISAAAGDHALEAAEALLSAAGAQWEREIGNGDPAHVLADMIERHGVDAVVMGAHDADADKGVLDDSVSQWLLQHAAVPVTLVRHVVADSD